ncbi:MAG: hydrogenase nickel incorporation protein HypB, partial [Desulfobacterales bacterium]
MPYHLFRQPAAYHRGHGHSHPHPHGGGADERKIQVERRILDENEQMAADNRRHFAAHGVFVLNLMSSPGSGKTTLLEKTLARLAGKIRCAVIVGDICTTHDADRLAASGMPVIQVNTDQFGGDCHLTAPLIAKAAEQFDLDVIDLLIVENVGNLVCPAEFDLGEDARVVVLSTTEGEDKPIKYPLMFRQCDLALINKIDLLPYLDFDLAL